MKLPYLFLLWAGLSFGAYAAPVQPIWSVPLGNTQLGATSLEIAGYYVLADGSVYFRSEGPGARARIRLWPDGRVDRHQEYENEGTRLVDDNGEYILLSGGDPATSLQLREHSGRTVWTRSIVVRRAKFFANGDVLAQSPRQVTRLRGSDGAVLWRRELLDLHPYAEESELQLAEEIDEQIDLAGTIRVRPRAPSLRTLSWQAALDPEDGSVRWSHGLASVAPPEDDWTCSNVTSRGVVVWVCQDQTFGPSGWVYHTRLQLYRHSDGLRWSTTLPDRTDDLLPTVLVGPAQIYFALYNSEKMVLGALDIERGGRQWESVGIGSYEVRLAATRGGDLLQGVRRSDGLGGSVSTIERRRASDGSLLWAIPPYAEGSVTGWRQFPDTLSVASVVRTAGDSRGRVQTFSLATGELLTTAEDVVRPFNSTPTLWTVAAGSYCHVSFKSFAAATLSCISSTSGTPLWTIDIRPPTPTDEINGIRLAPLLSGRLVLTIRYGRRQGENTVNLYAAAALTVATGTTAWQRIDMPVQPAFLGTGEGGALMLFGSCEVPPGCSDYQLFLERISGADGTALWSRPVPGAALTERDGLAILNGSGTAAPGITALDSRTGANAWNAALPQGAFGFNALISPAGQVVTANSRIMGASRQIEIRGFDRTLGVQNWQITPSIPSNVTQNGVLSLSALDGEDQLVVGVLRLATGQTVPWLASIDATLGVVHWERTLGVGRDRSRRAAVVGGTSMNGIWLDQTRESPSGLRRRSLARLGPQNGSVGREYQYASSRDVLPGDPSDLPAPTGWLADGSILALAWRESDGFALPVLQRWPAPTGPEGDVALDLAAPSPVLGHGPSARVELRVENRSPNPVAGARLAFISTWAGQSAHLKHCTAASGRAHCHGGEDDAADLYMDLGPDAVALLSYEVSGPAYRPAESTYNGALHFHLDLPYGVGDDPGDNTVTAELWLGGRSNGFE